MQATHPYGVRDVERLLGLSRNTLRALVSAGFVAPARGARNSWRFSFQDLIVLRTAQALVAARVPPRRITRSLRELRRHLPGTVPLSGLSIGADGDRVVVREGASRWQADSGQYLLEFEVKPGTCSFSSATPEPGTCSFSSATPKPGTCSFSSATPKPGTCSFSSATPKPGTCSFSAKGAEKEHVPNEHVPKIPLFEQAVALEETDARAAMAAYALAIDEDPSNVDARINLGLLLHEAGRLREAETVYRQALDACGSDPVLLYNIGVLLEDLKRKPEAAEAYEAAVRMDPGFADAHYNLAILCRELGRPQEALRHMAAYRRLAG